MKLLIAILSLCLLPEGVIVAQQKRGVSIHQDPRLAMLISKTKTPDRDDDDDNNTRRESVSSSKHTTAPAVKTKGSLNDLYTSIKTTPPVKPAKTTAAPTKPIGRSGIGSSRGGKYNGPGYRVQIYYGNNKDEALKREGEFIRHYPGIRTYFTFIPPNYRVKVGNYRSRDDANGMYKEANSAFRSCMIVPDKVSIK